MRNLLVSFARYVAYAGGNCCSVVDTVATDAAVLAASDAIVFSAETHSDNWARIIDASAAASMAHGNTEEDLSVVTFVTSQLHRRQLRHRAFVLSVLGCGPLASALSDSAIAALISAQENLLALRYLRDLQNAAVRDGLHEAMQRCIRQGIVAIGAGHRATAAARFFSSSSSSAAPLVPSAAAIVSLLLI